MNRPIASNVYVTHRITCTGFTFARRIDAWKIISARKVRHGHAP
jgi:hypothetical protein